ncbi:MAG: hypothetical protein ACYCVM_00915, partial [Acidiferrobacter sp.]
MNRFASEIRGSPKIESLRKSRNLFGLRQAAPALSASAVVVRFSFRRQDIPSGTQEATVIELRYL